ncbi:MAG TPA: filamentous hemagglutinin N-terminal domain-containing protein [Nitrospiria bacterium]|nr:filamentous hemagglutinin N-terminal domain-containing protein [Nitrospiria bacterium]
MKGIQGNNPMGIAALGCRIPIFILTACLIFPETIFGNPLGPTVVSGGATVSGVGSSVVTINQTTPKAILSWQQFNIAPNEVTRFIQPSTRSIALNRILDSNPSQIFGSLQANGTVILLNPNGVMFGPKAQVNVNGLVASSLNLTDANFLRGQYLFEGMAMAGSVKNAGTIQTGPGGFVYLLAPNVENSGLIKSPEGQIGLAAGTTAYLSERPDGQGFLVEVNNPTGEAINLKDLIADGGNINIYARVINQAGFIQANSVREKDGRIELFATQELNLIEGSVLSAKGSDGGISNGGTIVATSDKAQGTTRFDPGAVIDISGGAQGGNGGSVELSGHTVTLGGSVRGGATPGYQGGRFVLDPYDLTVTQNDLDPFSGLSEFDFQADHDLTVSGVFADLSGWSVFPASRGRITFTAGNDLFINNSFIVNDPSGLNGGAPWDIVATAGRDITLSNSTLGTGNGGNMTLQAGRNIIAPTMFDNFYQLYTGLRLDTNVPGTLTINAGGDFLGGFLVTNGQAHVNVGGNFGSADNYVNLTLGKGGVDVTASGSVYLGLIQDKGLAEPVNANLALTADPSNEVNLTATFGDVHLRPIVPDGENSPELAQLRQFYPASFSANAPQGTIFVEANLTFWPSPTGRLDFFAQDAIEGTSFNGIPPFLKLIPADPNSLVGVPVGELTRLLNTPSGTISNDVIPVNLRTGTGEITNLTLDFYSPTLRKQVTVQSASDITDFVATISVPDGVQGTVSATGNIDMTPTGGTVSGLHFIGTGDALVSAGGDINLATSQGIDQRYLNVPTNDYVPEGLLEIEAGGNLEMTQSTIVTYNGAAIHIHGLDGPDSPVGGSVNIGTNHSTGFSPFGTYLGVLTLRGGEIDIKATGDVNVNKSRVATLGGGDIQILSTNGDINAGSGGKNEKVEFIVEEVAKDSQGNIIGKSYLEAKVPGSGIFTFHPSDPNPLPDYPTVFDFPLPPDLAGLNQQRITVYKQALLGHHLLPWEQQLITVLGPPYTQYVAIFNKDWKLGSIDLKAPLGTVVVPSAGIRGKNISIEAKNLDLQGGNISGNLSLNVGQITGGLGTILGPVSGNVGGTTVNTSSGGGLGGLSGATGSISTTATATNASAVSTSQDDSTKKAAQDAEGRSESEDVSTADNTKGKRNRKTVQSMSFKKGVTIEVDVTDNPG